MWKTYLGRNRGVGTVQAVRDIYAASGLKGFWAGTSAKMVESASKGAILMYAKESLLTVLNAANVSPGGGKGGVMWPGGWLLRRRTPRTTGVTKQSNQPFLVETEAHSAPDFSLAT